MNQKRSDNFDKFSNKKKGSAVKEEYRQEKKQAKKKNEIDKIRGSFSLNFFSRNNCIFYTRFPPNSDFFSPVKCRGAF